MITTKPIKSACKVALAGAIVIGGAWAAAEDKAQLADAINDVAEIAVQMSSTATSAVEYPFLSVLNEHVIIDPAAETRPGTPSEIFYVGSGGVFQPVSLADLSSASTSFRPLARFES